MKTLKKRRLSHFHRKAGVFLCLNLFLFFRFISLTADLRPIRELLECFISVLRHL